MVGAPVSGLVALWFGCVVVAAVGTMTAAPVLVEGLAVASALVAGLALLLGCRASWVRLGWVRSGAAGTVADPLS